MEFSSINVMTILSCFDQVLVVFELLTACDAIEFFGRVVCPIIQSCRSSAWVDFREGCGRMMHVLENVFTGHSGEDFDLGEVRIRNLDRSGR